MAYKTIRSIYSRLDKANFSQCDFLPVVKAFKSTQVTQKLTFLFTDAAASNEEKM
ncbi:hypothetical protein N480_21645 [Pseudoalteromonas luteoviolacea S2607]|nr:hypothetical protein N480_21645 [Pseudoalteromonas luteoviolacea S2607]